jgi:hypothetical protein
MNDDGKPRELRWKMTGVEPGPTFRIKVDERAAAEARDEKDASELRRRT